MSLNPSHLLLVISLFTMVNASARDLQHTNESSLHVSRYVNVKPGPTKAQRNPMQMIMPNVVFNQNIKSVGQAIQFMLKDTGYRLARYHPDQRVHTMFRLSLPKIHRRMGPLTLAQGLETLSGEPWKLSVDPINRLISFQLPDQFKNAVYIKPTPVIRKVYTSHHRVIKKPIQPRRKATPRHYVKAQQNKKTIRPHHQIRKPTQIARTVNKAASKSKIKKMTSIKQKQKTRVTVLTWADIPAELR